MDEKNKHRLWLVLGLGGVGILILTVFHPSQQKGNSKHATTTQGATHTPPSTPNPANATIEESLIAARESALQTYDQSALGEAGVEAQRALGINEDQSQVAINANTNATQLKEVGLSTAAQQAIAELESTAAQNIEQEQIGGAENIENTQAGVTENGQNLGFFGSLLSGLAGIFGGFSLGTPTSPGPGVPSSPTSGPWPDNPLG